MNNESANLSPAPNEIEEDASSPIRALEKMIRPHTIATKDTFVMASNQLARAYQEGPRDIHDARITLLAIAKIDRSSDLLNDVCISIDEVKDIFPVYRQSQNIYSIVKATTAQMMGTHVLVEHKKSDLRRVALFSEVSYKRGIITVVFNAAVRDLLTIILTSFTRFPLSAIGLLESAHHVFLFLFARSYAYRGKVSATPMQLKAVLGIPTEKYPLHRSLLHFVIEPACRAITERSDIALTVKPIRIGRAIDHFEFTISLKRDTQFSVEEHVALRMLRERKISNAAATDAVRRNGPIAIVTKVAILEHRESLTHLKKIENTASYLAEMLTAEPVVDPSDTELQRRIRGKHMAFRQEVFANYDRDLQEAHLRNFARELSPDLRGIFERFKSPDATPTLRSAFARYLNRELDRDQTSITIERT